MIDKIKRLDFDALLIILFSVLLIVDVLHHNYIAMNTDIIILFVISRTAEIKQLINEKFRY